jgi:hypothetical protein
LLDIRIGCIDRAQPWHPQPDSARGYKVETAPEGRKCQAGRNNGIGISSAKHQAGTKVQSGRESGRIPFCHPARIA